MTLRSMPFPPQPEVKIDRYDGRALLDRFAEFDGKDESRVDIALESFLNFERYRSILERYRIGGCCSYP